MPNFVGTPTFELYRVGVRQLDEAWAELQSEEPGLVDLSTPMTLPSGSGAFPTLSPIETAKDPAGQERMVARHKERVPGRVRVSEAPKGTVDPLSKWRSGAAMSFGFETEGVYQRVRRYLHDHGSYELVAVSFSQRNAT